MTKEYESAAHESTGCRDYAFCRRVGPICAQRHHIGASKLLADCPDEVEVAGYFARCSCTRTLAELVDIIVAMEASISRKGTKGQCRGTLGKRAHAGHVAAMHSVHIQAGGMCLRVGESRYYNKGRSAEQTHQASQAVQSRPQRVHHLLFTYLMCSVPFCPTFAGCQHQRGV